MNFRAFKGRQNDWHTTLNLFLHDCLQRANDHTAIGSKTRLMGLSLILIHHATTPVLQQGLNIYNHLSDVPEAGISESGI